MKKKALITKKQLKQAVSQSSKMEGQSLERALRDTEMIKKLKQYGRAFSI